MSDSLETLDRVNFKLNAEKRKISLNMNNFSLL